MSFITQLLLNMLLIAAPILLYQLLWGDRLAQDARARSKLLAAGLSILSAILCMTYPLQFFGSMPYDLRMIALAACVLYAGLLPSLAAAAAIGMYQIMLGGVEEAILFLLAALPVIGCLLLIRRKVMTADRILRPLAAAAVGLTVSVITAAAAAVYAIWSSPSSVFDARLAVGILFYMLTHTAAAVLAACIITRIKLNRSLRKHPQPNERMNVLSELAASFAHEVRNPMTVARGFVQMLRQGDVAENKRQVYVQMVQEEIDRAQTVINDYLSFAKPQLDAIELLDAKLLVLRAVDSLRTFASLRHVDIKTELQDKLMISANAEKFIQCITHLCQNGIESMPGGGTLRIIGSLHSSMVSIDIIDHGIGMTPEEVGRLGTPYYSLRGKGNGLGMMVTYRAIHNIHGRIDVTSEHGKGTCFTLLLPTLQPSSYH
ncbi:two-component system, sporulation sensor kinase B [Paenibacillus sp. UNCCL117]|uniref:ATP-binding protein n=1 Tax=unclassified Paenibacillus TaxID=185978 RepID=UPI00088828DD|nr:MULTISPECIES: ATP-binding protein [unclassified Paenibacillus]SDD01233.1 two-component system, sporulation sensor kinase B [Paenibacillus sp. cl123]SFW32718.1 two-component system, sporulation sensor kinase B [Paenibacillus sp. UNCCL117]